MKIKTGWAAVALACAAISSFAADHKEHHAPHWGYAGHAGAKHWGDMEPGFATCKLGKDQSPINIRSAEKADLPALSFGYTASAAEVVNNGHTIQVNLADSGTVQLASGSYKLLQFHFHTPAEEKIRGRSYPLGVHLVHRNEAGELAVVGVLFKRGKENPALAKVFAAMPTHADTKAALPENFNPADLLPEKTGYYAFSGSLTTPPCSEGVRWQVLKQPVEASRAQIARFKKLYPMNARPVQPLNGRTVQEGG
jgi:carbonic anhydrase